MELINASQVLWSTACAILHNAQGECWQQNWRSNNMEFKTDYPSKWCGKIVSWSGNNEGILYWYYASVNGKFCIGGKEFMEFLFYGVLCNIIHLRILYNYNIETLILNWIEFIHFLHLIKILLSRSMHILYQFFSCTYSMQVQWKIFIFDPTLEFDVLSMPIIVRWVQISVNWRVAVPFENLIALSI